MEKMTASLQKTKTAKTEEEKNKLPEGWKRVRLGEVIEEVKERNVFNKYTNVLSISNVKGFVEQKKYFGRLLSSDDTSKYKVVRYGFFAYNPARINVGSIALMEKEKIGIISPMYVVFKTKKSLRPNYFKFYIQRENFKYKVINNTVGSVRESLSFENLSNFEFELPPLPEQQKIAQILETVDKTIEKTGKIIQKYKRIKQGLMQDLLTNGIDQNGKVRNPKTHKFKNSPLGMIPKEWEVVRLVEVVKKFQYGLSVPLLKEGKYMILKMDDIDGWYMKEKNKRFVNISDTIYKIFRLKQGDVLINRTNSIELVGKAFLFNLKKDYAFASYLIRFFIYQNTVDPMFLVIVLNFLHTKIKNLATPSVQQANINTQSLKNFLIPLPPLPEQQKIAQILSQIDKTIEKEQAYKEKLQKLKKGLMEDMLTGKVRVKV